MALVLMIDPDRERAAKLRQQLEFFDLTVSHVASAFEALTLIEREHPEVVMSRWDAGEMTAAELTAALRSDAAVTPFSAVLVLGGERCRAAEALRHRFDLVVDTAQPRTLAVSLVRLLAGDPGETLGEQASIFGTLDMLDLATLIQTMSSRRKTGVLALACGGHPGSVSFDDGVVRHACFRGEKGRQGFARLVHELQVCGRAPFTFEAMAPEQVAVVPLTIGERAQQLLMETMTSQDESRPRSVLPSSVCTLG